MINIPTRNNKKRYVLEASWSGYTSSQSRVCHRQVISAKKAAILQNLDAVRFTDNTYLYIEVREANFRETVKELKGYTELLNDCYFKKASGCVSVLDLRK